jgi:hypothetical protein
MKHYFRPYSNNRIFIETGTSSGDGVVAALNAGFPIIHSIELSNHYYVMTQKLFAKEKSVHLHFGNSLDILPQLLKNINEPCTFWLDAHQCGGEAAGKLEEIILMDELEIIHDHHIKEHTIIIDDMRLVRNKSMEWKCFPYTQEDIEYVMHQINPKYKIHYEFGVVENDILVARV